MDRAGGGHGVGARMIGGMVKLGLGHEEELDYTREALHAPIRAQIRIDSL
jgi:hypothetical protein